MYSKKKLPKISECPIHKFSENPNIFIRGPYHVSCRKSESFIACLYLESFLDILKHFDFFGIKMVLSKWLPNGFQAVSE